MNTADVPDRLLLDYRLDGGVAVVKVAGEVDVSTSGSLRDSLLRIITDENHHGLVVNLASVSFLDSTGLGVLVGIWHRVCATRGCLTLAAPSRQARSVLETTGLTRLLPIYDTEEAAVHACREPTTR
jgi:anti-sigma B factor antagonist